VIIADLGAAAAGSPSMLQRLNRKSVAMDIWSRCCGSVASG
jgi:hypothetical protein